MRIVILKSMQTPHFVPFLSDKLLKEEITGLLDCQYFNCLPPPPKKSAEVLLSSAKYSKRIKLHYITVGVTEMRDVL